MFIDRLLSRFRIQTKVLIFILPFVASISAVGLTGLYASGLLQGRMEISNNILQSLSGFRDVSTAMSQFLEVTTADNRDAVNRELEDQQAVLRTTLAQLAPQADGRAELEAATEAVDGVVARMQSLWSLHEAEAGLIATLRDGIASTVGGQADLSAALEDVSRAMGDDETAAKQLLRDADHIALSASVLSGINSAFSKLKTPEEKFDLVASSLEEMKTRHGLLVTALPEKNKSAARTLEKIIADLTALVAAGDKSQPVVDEMATRLRNFTQMSAYLNLAAQQVMKDATARFGELDIPLRQAQTIAEAGRALVSSSYRTQIVMAGFLLEPTDDTLARLATELAVMRSDLATFEEVAAGRPFLGSLKGSLSTAIDNMQNASAQLVTVSKRRAADFDTASSDLDRIWQQLTSFAELQKQGAGQERNTANSISIGATMLGIVISVFAGIGLVMTFKGPIGQITDAMRRLAEGVLDTRIKGEGRVDEIGEMARALGVFKQNALSKIEVEHRSEAERAAAEDERRRNDNEKQQIDSQIDFAVNALAAGLGRLSQGDISQTIETPFFGRLEQLRTDFNSSLVRLQDTMTQIRSNTYMIQRNAGEMSQSADELAKRTEQQAASLEETAAAVEQITTTVKSSAVQAEDANRIVAETKSSADMSSTVVANAIRAMDRIENASGQIVQIIDVIDDIAFQTNLLALNAGIEAARAGEAGKGFAVVAQEVRELAQRSAGAAHQIKDLIDRSSTEVASGARLVQQTGTVLSEISAKIVTVSERVNVIARASREQSDALGEVNSAVNQMDQMTQRNAAMVEETNAATRQLADEADALMSLVDRFKLAAATPGHQAARRAA